MKHPDPTTQESLESFADHYGTRWRSKLYSLWTTGSAELDKYPGLHALRNAGPSLESLWTRVDQAWEDKMERRAKHTSAY